MKATTDHDFLAGLVKRLVDAGQRVNPRRRRSSARAALGD
jgi:hypothetical protein